MESKLKTIAALSLAASWAAASASAATVTYSNTHTTPKLQLIVDDDASPGTYRFSMSTTVGTADFLALGFNYSGISLAQTDFSLVSATRADDTPISPSLALFGDNTGSQSDCGAGCNFNGSGSASSFDYILRIGQQGGGGDNYVKTVVFDLTAPGSLDMNPFSQFAARAQSTTNPEGSIKADLIPPLGEPPTPVPIPAGFPLLVGGLAAFSLVRKSRKA
ncbi:VPLPA-CTERM sorting domain-containing protein [Qingshengfaniella alkalisoli]|uniref:VPLPA-CTERM sorting domain-containing protein n=1 Tax=Qingshengfaniella alkalisoli TaxID=2599296 RepID=A0A5B8IUQ9_9RHOB|nr:VPLPA-CTERM sorting domain-containing protein [Qingshengfaniella alkalisoli]QDY68601.1 VPLPA-CTERM sorting domain-containing protein [Qingshengfaniella alkalisoli]